MEKFEYVPPEKLQSLLITKTAIQTLRSESLIQKVVGFQFQHIRQNIRNLSEVEVTGFGRFVESPHKIVRKMNKLIYIVEALIRRIERGEKKGKEETSYEGRVAIIMKELYHLRNKIRKHENKLQRDFGGRMEFNLCEGRYREGSGGENGDLSWLLEKLGPSEEVQQL